MERSEIPLTCDAAALPEAERAAHFALARRLVGLAEERTELVDGYILRYPAGVLADVARFIDNERRCCPFLTFELVIPANEDVVWLRMTGPAGTRAALDHELSLTEEV